MTMVSIMARDFGMPILVLNIQVHDAMDNTTKSKEDSLMVSPSPVCDATHRRRVRAMCSHSQRTA